MSPMGHPFVAMFESTTFPLFAMQFHAEKPLFEWPIENINHSADTIEAMSWLSRFMGEQARLSNHSFPSDADLEANLIYNWCPDFSISYSSFEQIYYW